MRSDAAAVVARPRWVLPLIVWGSVALALAVLAASGEANQMLAVLAGARWSVVVPLLAIGMILPVVHARRWQAMLRAVGHDLSLPDALDLTITSTMINYAAPGYLWSPAKGLMARQFHGVGLGQSVPTLAAEQGLDALALLLGTVAGLVAVGPDASGWLLARLESPSRAALAALLVAAALALVVAPLVARRFGRRFVASLAATARLLAADRALRVPVISLTLARWVLDVAAIWLAAEAVGVPLGLGPVVLLSNLPLLIGQLSPMPGGVGFREGAMAAVAGALELSVSAILAAAVLHRAALVAALPLLLGVLRLRRWSAAWR